MVATRILKPTIITSKQLNMTELLYLRNVLLYGDSDITCSQDVLAICTRIAQLEKELNNAESI